jgi:hypothetical protein
MPDSVREEIAAEGLELVLLDRPQPPIDAAHLFMTDRARMADRIGALRPLLPPGGFIWVSWPKRASGVATDITEDAIREIILPSSDLVDVKVCAVDATWSALKLMIRRERRWRLLRHSRIIVYVDDHDRLCLQRDSRKRRPGRRPQRCRMSGQRLPNTGPQAEMRPMLLVRT